MEDLETLTAATGLLWEESRRQLVRQEADLDGLRVRAAGILSVAALVAGLLGPHVVLTDHRWRAIPLTIALTCFGLCALCALCALAPRRERWKFAHDLEDWFGFARDRDLRSYDVTLNFAEYFDQFRRENGPEIQRLYDFFLLSCLFVALQVVAWGVAIA